MGERRDHRRPGGGVERARLSPTSPTATRFANPDGWTIFDAGPRHAGHDRPLAQPLYAELGSPRVRRVEKTNYHPYLQRRHRGADGGDRGRTSSCRAAATIN